LKKWKNIQGCGDAGESLASTSFVSNLDRTFVLIEKSTCGSVAPLLTGVEGQDASSIIINKDQSSLLRKYKQQKNCQIAP